MSKLLFIDLETTGVDPNLNGVVQVGGIVEIDGEEVERFDLRCQPFPGQRISAKALEVTGTKSTDLEGYAPPEEVHAQFCAILGKYVDQYDRSDKFWFVGYNSSFDFNFIHAWFKNCKDNYCGSWFLYPPLDVAVLAGWYLLHERVKMQDFKLLTVAQHLGLEVDEAKAHDAMYDIELTRDIFRAVTR